MKLMRAFCLMSLLGVSVAGLWICTTVQSQQAHAHGDQTPVAKASSSVSSIRMEPRAAAQPFFKTFSVFRSFHARLDTCVDFIVEVLPPEGADATWAPAIPPDLTEKLAKLGHAIDHPCLEEFAESAVLATCVTVNSGGGQTVRLVERHYEYTTVGLDERRMEDCVRLGGDWQAVAKNSPEFLHAKRTAIVQDLEGIAQGT